MNPRTRLLAVLIVSLVLSARAIAQDASHGWLVVSSNGARKATTIEPNAAFLLGSGETLHPEIAAAGLACEYRTLLSVEKPGEYAFFVEAEGGSAELTVHSLDGRRIATAQRTVDGGGESAGDGAIWTALDGEDVYVRVQFRRDGDQPCRLRTLWRMRLTPKGGFHAEPIPTRVTKLSEHALERAARDTGARRGILLLERKGCTNCHAVPEGVSGSRRPGPRLATIGERASAEWTRRWIENRRSGSDMPDAFSGAAPTDEQLGDLVHFLTSMARPAGNDSVATEEAVLVRGRDLYHRVGCVACHGALASPAEVLNDEFLENAVPAVRVWAPFGDLEGKWHPAALAAYLLDPTKAHPDGRMPSLDLSYEESDSIATYLLSHFGAASAETITRDEERARRGAALFIESSCHACHELDDFPRFESTAPALVDLDPSGGCLDATSRRTPHYDLTPQEREDIARGIASLGLFAGSPAPLEELRRSYDRLGCVQCHEQDGTGGVHAGLRTYFVSSEETVDLGDEGRLSPDLSGAGFKLTTTWLTKLFFDGERSRPYLAARMPSYDRPLLDRLPERMATREGVHLHSDVDAPEITDDSVLAGRGMMGRAALNCTSCHVYNDHAPSGSPGLALTQFAERLRYEWYHAYMQDPVRYKPGTRMPSFGTGGESTLSSVLGGDSYAQTDAMWAYFTLGEFAPPPDDLTSRSSMKLEPTEHPIVMRTFLPRAGSRGIAVGFPIGLHYSFDALKGRLIEVWKGNFLDASGAWAGRGGNVSDGRGEVLWKAPRGPALVFAAPDVNEWLDWPARNDVEFGGYRLDENGVPTFRYTLDGLPLTEHVELFLSPAPRLVRTFHLKDVPDDQHLWLRTSGKTPTYTALDGGLRANSSDGVVHFACFHAEDGVLTFRVEVAL